MYFYIGLFLIFSFFLFCYSNVKDKYLSLMLKISCFLIIFIPAAIRYNIGTDYSNYVGIFNRFSLGKEMKQEFGWRLINQFVYKNGLDVQWIFIISSFITYVVLFKTNKKDSFITLIIYFLYLYTFSYNGVRNAISISFFWYSYICLINEKKLRGFIFILIGSLFHSSALIYLPLYCCMCFVPISKKMTIFIGICCFILFSRLNLATLILESPIFGKMKYAAYLNRVDDISAVKIGSGLGMLLRFFCTFLLYILCDEKKCKKNEFQGMSWLFIALIATDSLSVQIFIFYRLVTIFYVAYMVMFMIVFRKTNNGLVILGRCFCLLYVIIFVFVAQLKTGANGVIPYISII